MANNYTESSFSIDDLTVAEKEWWKKEFQRECPEDLDPENMEVPVSNDWEFDDDSVWFHHDECDLYINTLIAALVVQRFLKECRPGGSVGFTWSETCSKPRLGEFGGGACFITAEEIKWMSAYSWLLTEEEKVRENDVS